MIYEVDFPCRYDDMMRQKNFRIHIADSNSYRDCIFNITLLDMSVLCRRLCAGCMIFMILICFFSLSDCFKYPIVKLP